MGEAVGRPGVGSSERMRSGVKILGVLGGMGPAATVAFLARVQALTPAAGDEDHIRVIADINPQVPNRHTQPEAAGRTLGEMARALKAEGFRFCGPVISYAFMQATGMVNDHLVSCYRYRELLCGECRSVL